jgi:hypothetical protein
MPLQLDALPPWRVHWPSSLGCQLGVKVGWCGEARLFSTCKSATFAPAASARKKTKHCTLSEAGGYRRGRITCVPGGGRPGISRCGGSRDGASYGVLPGPSHPGARRGSCGALYRELIEEDMTEDELELNVWLVELDEIEEDWIEDEKPCLE